MRALVREKIRGDWRQRQARAPLTSRHRSPLSPMRRYVWGRRMMARRLARLRRLEELDAPRIILTTERQMLERTRERFRQAGRQLGLPAFRIAD
jgi:hypothetical protein